MVYDTLLFGHAENSCLLLRGGPGTGKTHTICKLVDSLMTMNFKTLLVAKADNTVDIMAARVVTELDNNAVARRFSSPASLGAYAFDRSLRAKSIHAP